MIFLISMSRLASIEWWVANIRSDLAASPASMREARLVRIADLARGNGNPVTERTRHQRWPGPHPVRKPKGHPRPLFEAALGSAAAADSP